MKVLGPVRVMAYSYLTPCMVVAMNSVMSAECFDCWLSVSVSITLLGMWLMAEERRFRMRRGRSGT